MFGLKKKRGLNKNGDERKERSDKKTEIQPTISVSLKTQIERLAAITDQPIKYIGELLCYEGIHSPEVVEYLSPHFKATVRAGHHVFFGHEDNPPYTELTTSKTHKTDRISIRFPPRDYEDIKLLSRTLDVNPTRATAILLDASIRKISIVEKILTNYNLRKSFDYEIEAEIKRLTKFINNANPYQKDRSWNNALLNVVGEIGVATRKMRALPKNIMDKMVDRETYQWTLDEPVGPVIHKKKPRKKPASKKVQE